MTRPRPDSQQITVLAHQLLSEVRGLEELLDEMLDSVPQFDDLEFAVDELRKTANELLNALVTKPNGRHS